MEQLQIDAPAEAAAIPCRWCGTSLNPGFHTCTTCLRGQSVRRDLMSSPSALISILAAVLSLLQLAATWYESQKSQGAAAQAQQAQQEILEAKSKIVVLQAAVQETQRSVGDLLHQSKRVLAMVAELSAPTPSAMKREEIEIAQAAVDSARATYASTNEQIQKTSPTVQRQVPLPQNCMSMPFGNRTCVGGGEVLLTVPNPEHASLAAKLEQSSKELAEAEASLLKLLAPEACSPGQTGEIC